MADFYSNVGTTQNTALTQGGTRVSNGFKLSGVLQMARVSYALAGTETTNDTLYLARLPKGSVIVPKLCVVECDDPGTTLTIDVGYLYDDGTKNVDEYADGLVLSAGGDFVFSDGGTVAASQLTPYQLTADAWITVTPAAVDTLTASADLTFLLTYVQY